ncbi:MAG: hypothetical protein KHX35_05760 [Sutterella wadsworthensis]|nr:hypothetical protein [Sutterella wadsworthensis]
MSKKSVCPLISTNVEVYLANNSFTRLFREVEGINYADEAWVKARVRTAKVWCSAIFVEANSGWTTKVVSVYEAEAPDAAFLGWLMVPRYTEFCREEWEAKVTAWLRGFFCFGEEGRVAAASSTYRDTVWHDWVGQWPKSLAECVMELVENQIRILENWDFPVSFLDDSKGEEAWKVAKEWYWSWEDWDNLLRDQREAERLLAAFSGLLVTRPAEEDIETLAFLEERVEELKKLHKGFCHFIEVVGSETERFLP